MKKIESVIKKSLPEQRSGLKFDNVYLIMKLDAYKTFLEADNNEKANMIEPWSSKISLTTEDFNTKLDEVW